MVDICLALVNPYTQVSTDRQAVEHIHQMLFRELIGRDNFQVLYAYLIAVSIGKAFALLVKGCTVVEFDIFKFEQFLYLSRSLYLYYSTIAGVCQAFLRKKFDFF